MTCFPWSFGGFEPWMRGSNLASYHQQLPWLTMSFLYLCNQLTCKDFWSNLSKILKNSLFLIRWYKTWMKCQPSFLYLRLQLQIWSCKKVVYGPHIIASSFEDFISIWVMCQFPEHLFYISIMNSVLRPLCDVELSLKLLIKWNLGRLSSFYHVLSPMLEKKMLW